MTAQHVVRHLLTSVINYRTTIIFRLAVSNDSLGNISHIAPYNFCPWAKKKDLEPTGNSSLIGGQGFSYN
jgi:hypothetical protein